MRLSPNNIFIKEVMENVLKEALLDVTPPTKEIRLMMPQKNGGSSNKKKKFAADKKFTKGKAHVASIVDEQTVCAKALECLCFLTALNGGITKPALMFILQEKILAVGFAISSRTQEENDLYRDPMCRVKLSDLVTYMMTHPVATMPTHINHGIALLTKTKNSDPDVNVRNAASMNLNRAEPTIRSRKEAVYFPPEYRDLRDTLMFNRQTINRFNEALNLRGESANEVSPTAEALPTPDGTANIIISDNESKDDDEIVTNGNASRQVEAVIEPMEVNEISDEDTQEISDSDEPEIVQPPPKADKRASRSRAVVTPPKKQRNTDSNNDELLDEYLADFTDEVA